MFDHFVGLALKGLSYESLTKHLGKAASIKQKNYYILGDVFLKETISGRQETIELKKIKILSRNIRYSCSKENFSAKGPYSSYFQFGSFNIYLLSFKV